MENNPEMSRLYIKYFPMLSFCPWLMTISGKHFQNIHNKWYNAATYSLQHWKSISTINSALPGKEMQINTRKLWMKSHYSACKIEELQSPKEWFYQIVYNITLDLTLSTCLCMLWIAQVVIHTQ
jgi:hypothetical protein